MKMYCWVTYIHSYQYIPKNYNDLELKNNYIKSSNENIIYLLNIPKENKDLYRIYFKKEKNCYRNVKILVDVNIPYLEYLVHNGMEIPNRTELFKLIRRNSDNKLNPNNLINNIIDNTHGSNFIPECKSLFKKKIKYVKHNFQINNLEWMINLEKNIANKIIHYTSPEIIQTGNLFLDVNLERFYLKDYLNQNNDNIIFKGGALVDNHFTGRKETIIDLIKLNPPGYIKPKELHEDIYLKSKTNLIICSSQQSVLWDKILKKNNINYCLITNKNNFDKYTYTDLLNVDFVIITTKFISSLSYKNQLKIYQQRGQSIRSAIISYNMENIRNPSICSKKLPLLNLIYWYRVFYFDSLNYIINDDFVNDYINTINSKFKWCIETTPFSNKENFKDIIKLLTVNNSFTEYKEIGNYVVNNIFRKNDLYYLSKEFNTNITTNHIWLDFSLKEKYIYENYLKTFNNKETDLFLRKMCTCLQITNKNTQISNNFKNYDDIHKCMIENNMNYIKYLKNKNINIKNQLEKINKSLDNNYLNNSIDKLLNSKKDLEFNYNKNESEIKNTTNVMQYLQSVISKVKLKKTENCSICFSEIMEKEIAITKCGHIFCCKCICNSIQFNKKCPICREELFTEDIFSLKKNDINLDFIKNIYGTKISKLIEIIKTYENKKILILSEFDDILFKLNNLLFSLEFNTNFKSNKKDANIILENIFDYAKINTTNYIDVIIFLNPIYNHKYYRDNIENNIINFETNYYNKRNIQIIKLFMNNSIEEKIYNNKIIFS